MLFTIPENTIERVVDILSSDRSDNVGLIAFPGSEDEELIDELIQSLSTNKSFFIAQVNLREFQENIIDITSSVIKQVNKNFHIGTKKYEEIAKSNPVHAIIELNFDLQTKDRRLLLILRKLHYIYFNETLPEIRLLLQQVPYLFSTYISPSRFFSEITYASPFFKSIATIHLSPNILPEKRNIFLEDTLGKITLTNDEERLLSLAKNNRAILLYCIQIIKENISYHNHSWDFDLLLRKTYDISRGYFSNAWDCFELSEKAVLINLSVEWANKKRKRLLTAKRDSNFMHSMIFTRLINYDFVSMNKDIPTISSPLFAYWIIFERKKEVWEDLDKGEFDHVKGSWLKRTTLKTLEYLDKNKDVLTQMAFELLKNTHP